MRWRLKLNTMQGCSNNNPAFCFRFNLLQPQPPKPRPRPLHGYIFRQQKFLVFISSFLSSVNTHFLLHIDQTIENQSAVAALINL